MTHICYYTPNVLILTLTIYASTWCYAEGREWLFVIRELFEFVKLFEFAIFQEVNDSPSSKPYSAWLCNFWFLSLDLTSGTFWNNVERNNLRRDLDEARLENIAKTTLKNETLFEVAYLAKMHFEVALSGKSWLEVAFNNFTSVSGFKRNLN